MANNRLTLLFLVPILLALDPGWVRALDNVTQMPLSNVRHWGYNIQKVHTNRQYEQLLDSHFDMYVLEVVVTEDGMEDYDIAGLIHDIRQHNKKIRGVDPLVLAYVDMGQAEDWRWYWGKDWKIGNPDWIVGEDPNDWEGNFPVAYWYPEWEDIVVYGYKGRSHVNETLAAGFDGIYMDWVEAFSDDNVLDKIQVDFGLGRAAAKQEAAKMMLDFVAKIRNHARATNPNYLVIAQNASDLYEYDPARYEAVIDAIALEAIWYDGYGDSSWNDPDGYNVRTNDFYPGWTEEVLRDIKQMKSRFPVFCAEYAQDLGGKKLATRVYKDLAPGVCVPYATRRALSKLSTTPYPTGYRPRDYSRPPSRPRLRRPANNATVTDTTPTFDWRNSKGFPTRYKLQVDDDPRFSSPEINTRRRKSRFIARSPLNPGTYYWRVRARDIVGDWSRWSARRSFRVPVTATAE